MSSNFDVLALIKLIKLIVFKFDDHKFLPVSLHQAKQSFYNLRQVTMSNEEYLEMFNNHVNITTSYAGEILNAAILEYTRNRAYPNSNTPLDQDQELMRLVCLAAKELCLVTGFILQCDRCCYGKLLEELEIDFTKGHNNYPVDMVKVYQLLNKCKLWRPTTTAPVERHYSIAI